MCGINGLLNPLITAAELAERVRTATRKLHHRGPDDKGLWTDGKIALGHTRLAIIDLTDGRQPMLSPDARNALVFNGEIYNYGELRRQLGGEWRFRTRSDTEVVLAGLLTHGPEFLNRMDGMWALALWDGAESRLFLSRDRLGKKPLYYFCDRGVFGFASEIPALRELSGQLGGEDPDGFLDYFRYGYYRPGETILESVKEVLPGHYLRLDYYSPEPVQVRYWEMTPRCHPKDYAQAADQLKTLVVGAVRKRLVADVEIGVFLSAGMDSNLVVATLVQSLNTRLQAFSIGFSNPGFDESDEARRLAEAYAVPFQMDIARAWSLDDLSRFVKDHLGQPFYDPSLIPTSLLCQIAAKSRKVCLSGDGGDEIFSGYQRYQGRVLLRWYMALPKEFRRSLEKAIRLLPEPMVHHHASLLKKAHLFTEMAHRDSELEYYLGPRLFAEDELIRLAPDRWRPERPDPLAHERRMPTDIQEMMYRDCLVYLPQDILLKVDRASMAHSLEVRCPLLDPELMAFAFGLPLTMHRTLWRGKRLVRHAFRDQLPHAVLKRRKQGFAPPVFEWFMGKAGDLLVELLGALPSTGFDNRLVQQMLDRHRRGQRDEGARLWSILIYLLWRTQQAHAI